MRDIATVILWKAPVVVFVGVAVLTVGAAATGYGLLVSAWKDLTT